MEFEILYQDEFLVAMNKPAGLLVHPSEVAAQDTVCCMMLLKKQLGGVYLHPLHRLDRPTSGVLLFALNADVTRTLATAFQNQEIEKQYLAVARGHAPEHFEIDKPLATPKKYLRKKGKKNTGTAPLPVPARTTFETLELYTVPEPVGRYETARYSLVRCTPHTGRIHQIRRHLRKANHPIVNDRVYGDGDHNLFFSTKFGVERLLLHAEKLAFTHPVSGARVELKASPPEDFSSVLQDLRARFTTHRTTLNQQ